MVRNNLILTIFCILSWIVFTALDLVGIKHFSAYSNYIDLGIILLLLLNNLWIFMAYRKKDEKEYRVKKKTAYIFLLINFAICIVIGYNIL